MLAVHAAKSLRNFVFKTGVADELNVVGTGARKDEFAQHLLAKTVNRQDARLIKMLERTFDQHCRIMFPRTGALEKASNSDRSSPFLSVEAAL